MSDGSTISKPVSRRLRFEILRRDNMTCRYCGASAPDVKLTVDHVVPRALGGSDNPDNLVAACVDCNAGKTSVAPDQSIVDDVSEAHFRWASAMARAGEESRSERSPETSPLAVTFDAIWTDWVAGGEPLPRPSNWAAPLRTWDRNGLTMDDLKHYVGVAMQNKQVTNRNKWRYFCGCCWAEIRRREERAAELLAGAVEPERSEWGANTSAALFANPDCGGCGGGGYVLSGDDVEECWCVTAYPPMWARL